MESQPQNPESRNNAEKFHPCYCVSSSLVPWVDLSVIVILF